MAQDTVYGPSPTMAQTPVDDGAPPAPTPMAEQAVEQLQAHFPDTFFEVRRFRNEVTAFVPRELIVPVCEFLKREVAFNYLSDLTGNDWPDRDPRFEVIYHLHSMKHFGRLRLKVRVPEDELSVPSVTSVWATANWHERETFDLFGINFENHPDLRRILLPDEWDGHPLRQDEEIGWEEPEFTVRKVSRPYAKG